MTERSQLFESSVWTLIPIEILKGTKYEIMNGFSRQSDIPSYPLGNSLVQMNHDTVDPQVIVADY